LQKKSTALWKIVATILSNVHKTQIVKNAPIVYWLATDACFDTRSEPQKQQPHVCVTENSNIKYSFH
jgi:hypothetical protein